MLVGGLRKLGVCSDLNLKATSSVSAIGSLPGRSLWPPLSLHLLGLPPCGTDLQQEWSIGNGSTCLTACPKWKVELRFLR